MGDLRQKERRVFGLLAHPVVFTRKGFMEGHGLDVNSYPIVNGMDCYRDLFKNCDLLTANTNLTESRAVSLGCAPGKVKILPAGLDISKFRFRPKAFDGAVRLLTVSRLAEVKGHEYMIKAVSNVVKRYPNTL